MAINPPTAVSLSVGKKGKRMKELIDVFRMTELDPKTRARIIIKLGNGINDQMSMNITEPIVVELVSLLDPENEILTQDHYKQHLV